MMRSMFSGVSGLRNHQIRMDVIGNNIANVNTVGFKASRANFAEIFSQTLRGASAPRGGLGGTNPQQVGLGMSLSSIDTLHTQGNLQTTGKMSDLAIQGNGFFILSDGGSRSYTRAGNFDVDAQGYLTSANGLRVMGWTSDANGLITNTTETNLAAVRIPVGSAKPAVASTRVGYSSNLDARVAVGPPARDTSMKVYDSLGNTHELVVSFQKSGTNQWGYTVTVDGAAPTGGATGTIQFTTTGLFDAVATGAITPVTFSPTGANGMSVAPDFTNVTQFASDTTIEASSRDGYPMGALNGYTIDSAGVITGNYSNGLTQTIAQIGIAAFVNPGGLLKAGDNLFLESNNSGMPQVGQAGTGMRGSIAPSSLEMANVDLSQEFTNMIITQRGFQANSKIISVSDEMLQELVNMKR